MRAATPPPRQGDTGDYLPERQRRLHLRLARNDELRDDPQPYAEGRYEDIDFSA
jgi:hypothetical protein